MKKITLCLFSILCVADAHSINDITQAIIPMAGLGTRLLPISKSCPKCMVPVIDRPALHHVVDEALESNIVDFCFIVNENEQQTIEYYFSSNPLLDAILKEKKKHFLDPLNTVISQSHFTYIVQPEPLGLGHAVLMGEPFIKEGSFFCVMLPDNIIESDDPHMARLIALAQQYNASVITVEEIDSHQALQYAVVTPKEFLTDDVIEVADIIEKPQCTYDTPFCLCQVGRQVLSYDIFESLKAIEPGVNGEIQLTDAVRHMIKSGKRVLACKLKGKRYDTGTIHGLLHTTVSLALHNPLYKTMIHEIISQEIN